MRKIIFYFTVTSLLLTGSLFSSCQSSAQKEKAARDNVAAAQEDLDAAKVNAEAVEQKVATAEEFKTFKLESKLQIKTNEVRIAEINLEMDKPGTLVDKLYIQKIDSLEQKNLAMETRITDYEKNHSDWTIFKREFKRDMTELGQALKDLTVKNKK